MGQFCRNCGGQINSGASFCSFCGANLQTEAQPGAEVQARGLKAAGPPDLIETNTHPGRGSLRQFLKNPRQLMPMVVLGVFWLALSLLPALGINPLPVHLLSFLTFAQGGMYGGVLGALGGIIGKAVFGYFVSVLILPLFSGKNPFKGMGMGFKDLISSLALQSVNAAAHLILGIGLALILFNFFTGNASPVNSMAGIVGFMLALKALLSRGDFIRGLFISVASKLTRGRTPSPAAVSRVIAGYAVGSAAGVAFSALPQPYLPYAVGVLLFVVGLVLSIVIKPPKAVLAV